MGFLFFLLHPASRLLLAASRVNTINNTPSTQHHPHNIINTSPNTPHQQQHTINTTTSTQQHQHNTINTTSSAQHHQHITATLSPHNIINKTPSTQHHQHITATPSTQHHQHIPINTSPSTDPHQHISINTQHHQHITTTHHHNTISTWSILIEVSGRPATSETMDAGCFCMAGAALGASQARFEHSEHLQTERSSGSPATSEHYGRRLLLRGRCST